uniref:Reverse transcriptase Ty1/copia-type domain-containing protein n=1 Tax=Peronospora matthiolae TaxID=2874970 RepID=A0AAV1TBH9_9STRA
MEAEFVAATKAARELLELRKMLSEIGMAWVLLIKLYVDNQAAIGQISGEAQSVKAKHIDVRLEFLCCSSRRGVIAACYLRSKMMLADLMKKAYDASKLASLRGILCIG